ncbi:unnamed protein product [Clonostachys rhizophaga]|uniref:Uncharacterized protein n=1 Tax=Clonostachys rhizophaga TaxID=160324 RepID=A0A9N9YRE3_9HYPO|nr:unnamed protein product [Clonostachys rhizophaga]
MALQGGESGIMAAKPQPIPGTHGQLDSPKLQLHLGALARLWYVPTVLDGAASVSLWAESSICSAPLRAALHCNALCFGFATDDTRMHRLKPLKPSTDQSAPAIPPPPIHLIVGRWMSTANACCDTRSCGGRRTAKVLPARLSAS